jgi:predicted negative regulator of RcsB-dependent stress response
MTRDSVDPPASFARRYGLSIALGVLVVVAAIMGLMGLRLWLDHRAEQPLVGPYKHFIEQLAAASPEARSELQRYLAASGRDSVASQDFLPLCATMLQQAQAQDVKLELNMTLEQFHSIRALCERRRP